MPSLSPHQQAQFEDGETGAQRGDDLPNVAQPAVPVDPWLHLTLGPLGCIPHPRTISLGRHHPSLQAELTARCLTDDPIGSHKSYLKA